MPSTLQGVDNIPHLYPLDATSTLLGLKCYQLKLSSAIAKCLLGSITTPDWEPPTVLDQVLQLESECVRKKKKKKGKSIVDIYVLYLTRNALHLRSPHKFEIILVPLNTQPISNPENIFA